jgi:N-methylhydantoinase A/oxoprolinase/acetone carboxylase beta subunit
MMLSNGGISTVSIAKSNPIAMVESGPASGIYAAAHLGQLIGERNLIVLDIGGTTAKCTLVEGGEVRITTDYFVERTRQTPGYPIQTPVSEIVEIGNGGGSIAWVDQGGKLHVGPQSAGARPGPVAYGRGGTEPTTTDANLLLGRIDPAGFAGGEIEPDWHGVRNAFERLGAKLAVSPVEAARGVVRIANANMTNALRLVSTNRGYDPREFALMAFGGGGAMHAVALAEELKVPRVIVPVNSSVFSAWGMLVSVRRRPVESRLPFAQAVQPWGSCRLSPRAAALDLRQNLVDHGVLGQGLAEGAIQALEQLRDRLAVAAHERDAHLLALCGERSAPDRRDLPEGDLAAGIIEEGLQVAERCGGALGLEHGRARYAARASVAWLG